MGFQLGELCRESTGSVVVVDNAVGCSIGNSISMDPPCVQRAGGFFDGSVGFDLVKSDVGNFTVGLAFDESLLL